MIHSVIGISDDIDLAVAIEDVIAECQNKWGDWSCLPQVGILFTSCMDANFSDLLARILREFPDLQLIGCTTDGEISRQTGFIEDSLALLLLSSDTLQFATAVATDLSQNAEASFRAAFADGCRTLPSKPVCAFTFPDGLTTIGIALDEAIRHAFGEFFPVFGGTAGDHSLFTHSYQFCNDRVYSDAAPILLIAGEVQLTSAVRIGPIPTGLHFALGRHKNNVVYEIDGKTAVAFFREHLGDYSEQISEFPLAVYEKNDTDFYLRDPLHLNEDDGSITFIGTFPEHCTVRLTLVSRKDVLDAAEQANLCVLDDESGTEPELILIFPCTWVRHVLGSKTSDKFALIRQAREKAPFFGFYCYGEIAPVSIGTPARFHNDAYVIVALRSRNS